MTDADRLNIISHLQKHYNTARKKDKFNCKVINLAELNEIYPIFSRDRKM